MSAPFSRSARLGSTALAGLLAAVLLPGCSSVNRASVSVASWITPYKVEVVQGNFISREQVEALKPGMGRGQVRDILGTPLLTSVFHGDRWDYVFTFQRQGTAPQSRRFVVFFKEDSLERFEGDEMPSESEFVALVDPGRKSGKVPVLEASAESLKPFAPPAKPAAAAPEAALPPLPTSYPPLEPPAR